MVHAGDVGLVTAAREVFSETLTLTSGRTLAGFELITETYGRLNTQRSNAVLICHALSGNHHAAGRYDLSDPNPDGGICILVPVKRLIPTDFLLCPSIILVVVTAARGLTQ